MMTRNGNKYTESLEQYVPEDSMLRIIAKNFDFNFIYDIVAPYYPPTGVYSIDPVILYKMELINILFGMNSRKRVTRECATNLEYRWFLGLEINESIPSDTTIAKVYKRKFLGTDVAEQIFNATVLCCIDAGLVDGEDFFTDSTHIKAYANKNKASNEELTVEEKPNLQLHECINKKRKEIGLKNLKTPYPKNNN